MPDLLGAHMSIAGGLARAVERGLEVGCSVVQIFLKNQRQWTAGPYAHTAVRQFSAAGIGAGWAGPFRVGICLDTCHLFAAGYDTRTADGYRDAMGRGVRLLGARRVRAFHLNDARQPLGSGLDRHEKIGRGHLGAETFRRLMNDRRFARVPMALETPKDPEPRADREALALLRSLRAGRR